MARQDFFPPVVQIILTIFIIALVIGILYLIFKDVIAKLFSKTVTVHATLISKAQQQFVTQRVYVGGGNPQGNVSTGVAEKGMEYSCSFQLDDGKYVTLLVSKDFYDVVLEGGKGMLTYKGKDFVSYDGPTEGTRVRTDNNPNNFVGVNKIL